MTDHPPGWVYPEGVPLDHPLPDTWFAVPGVDDDEALTEIVANEAGRIVGELTQPTKLLTLSGQLIRSLGPDAKRAWAKPKTFKTFLAHAVPTAQIFSDGTGWLVPEGVTPDPPLLDPWFPPTRRSQRRWSMTMRRSQRSWPMKHVGSSANSRARLRFTEIYARLNWSLGEDARRTKAKFQTLKAFLEYAVPSAQILTDRPPGWVYPEGVPLDHPLPDSWFAVPGVHDDEALTEIVANETRRLVGELSRPATLTEVSTGLIKSLGPDAKRAWAKPKTFKAFLAYAVPSAQIFTDRPPGWVVPRGGYSRPPTRALNLRAGGSAHLAPASELRGPRFVEVPRVRQSSLHLHRCRRLDLILA